MRVFHALIVCSDGDCADLFEAWGTLEELEALACECGCALQILTISEVEGEPDEPLELQPVG